MKVPIWQVIRSSWRDTWRAFGAMPKLALILFAISCLSAFAALLDLLRETWVVAAITFIIPCAAAALYAPVLIALHRYVLMDQVTGRYEFDLESRRFRRYFGYSLVFVLLGAIPFYANIPFGENEYGAAVAVVGFGIYLAAGVWAALMFPAIGVDASNVSWAAAFRDMRGNFWRAFLIFSAIVVPASVAVIASPLLDSALTDSLLELRPIEQFKIGIKTVTVGLIWSAVFTLMTALSVVAASHLYRMLANCTACLPTTFGAIPLSPGDSASTKSHARGSHGPIASASGVA